VSGSPPPFRAPEPLDSAHDLSVFDCGAPELNDWLRRRALANQESGGSRSYVACAGQEIVGYYCLATGAVSHAEATGRVRRNMPDPIPVMVLGRLAVDFRWQGRGIGRALLRDAILRTVQAADIAGIRALLVHAKSPEAKKFYEACGFGASPVAPMTLMITIADAKRSLGI
jgi:GNAT superfamily N-acetyltransferase